MKKILFLLVLFFLSSVCFADEYVLVMSKDDNVCQQMMKAFNEDLRQYGDIKFDQHEEFTAIKWEIKRRYRIDEKGERDYDDPAIRENFLLSSFDINNDGKNELVLKSYERGLKGNPSDNIYVFRTEDSGYFKEGVERKQEFYERAMSILGGAFGREPFSNNTYSLKEIPPMQVVPQLGKEKNVKVYHFLGGWFYFNPFLYKGVYYVTMTDWQPHQVGKWLVILKLNPENKLQDSCYYRKNRIGHNRISEGR